MPNMTNRKFFATEGTEITEEKRCMLKSTGFSL
jgi:hypothetical protein